MSDHYEGKIDYDQYSNPDEVYDVVSRGRYHSLSTNAPTQEGSTTYRINVPSGVTNVGNAWADVDNSRYGLDTNSHGRVDELWQQFWLYIPDDFVLNNTDHRFWVSAISYSSGGGHSARGQPTGDNGWSVRLQLSDRGGSGFNLVEFTYNMDDRIYNIHDAPIDYGWNHFVTHVKCNTFDGGSANADGVSECWVDGELVFSRDDLRFTTTESNKIEYGGIAGFYGGGAPRDVSLYYDAHKLDTAPGEERIESTESPEEFDSALTTSTEDAADRAIVHDSYEMAAGNRYEATLQFESTERADMGLLFGAQTSGGFGSYTGYLAFLDANNDEIRLDRWIDGSQADAQSASGPIPAGEPLTLTIDWRHDDPTETRFTVNDQSGTELAGVSTSDTTYDSGGMGIYRYHTGGNWFLDAYGRVDGAVEEPEEDADDTDEFRTLEVAGQFEYRVEVDGEIRPSEAHAQWLSEGDAYGDDWAEWWLSGNDGARTVWEFTGEITTLEIDDYDGETEIRTLAVDGDELDHNEFVEDDGPSELEVAGQFEYRVEVDGEIWPAEAHAQWLSEGDAYGDDWAEWWLSGNDGARTVWEFTGEITTLEIDDYDGETEIRTLAVDGDELDY